MEENMSSVWINHARHIKEMINKNNETQAHLYLEQLLLFPVNIQDQIIDEISYLRQCNDEAIASIINKHTIMELK